MFSDKHKFRFPKGLSFFKKLELKKLCRNTNIYDSGYSSIIDLLARVNANYSLKVSLNFYNGTITFSFENLEEKVEA